MAGKPRSLYPDRLSNMADAMSLQHRPLAFTAVILFGDTAAVAAVLPEIKMDACLIDVSIETVYLDKQMTASFLLIKGPFLVKV